MMSAEEWRLMWLNQSQFILYSLFFLWLAPESFPSWGHKNVFLFPKKCEYVLPKLLICLKSILVNGVRSRSRFLSCFSLFYITDLLVQHHLLKIPPFPLIVDVASSLYMCPVKNGQGLVADWIQTREDSGEGAGREAVIISRKPPQERGHEGLPWWCSG